MYEYFGGDSSDYRSETFLFVWFSLMFLSKPNTFFPCISDISRRPYNTALNKGDLLMVEEQLQIWLEQGEQYGKTILMII
jgi:hypothetical protein